MVIISRDGSERARVNDLDEAFKWLIDHQGMSVDYALRNDGWTAVDEETGESLKPYSGPVWPGRAAWLAQQRKKS